MVVSCSALGCKRRFQKGAPYTFHRFPKDEKLRKLWEKLLGRKDFISTKNSKICSKHFEPYCFDTEKLGGTWLKPDAVPTIFDFSSNRDKKEGRRTLKKDSEDNPREKLYCNSGLFTEEELNFLKEKERKKVSYECSEDRARAKRYWYLGDYTKEDMNSPEKSRKVLEIAKMLQLKNKLIKRKNKLLANKYASLQAAMNKISKKFLASGMVIQDDFTPITWKKVHKKNAINTASD